MSLTSNWRYARHCALFCAVALPLAFATAVGLSAQARTAPTAVVPSVVGMELAEAEAVLSRLRIGPITTRDTVVSGADPGTVVGQSPMPRTRVTLPTPATLWVARGPTLAPGSLIPSGGEFRVPGGLQVAPGTQTVPDLRGRPLEEGMRILAEVGLRGTIEWVNATGPTGIVLRQLPAAGTVVERGTVARLFVAPDPAPQGLPVPRVVGQPLEVAFELFGRARIQIEAVDRLVVAGAAEGTVVRQLPPAGSIVTPGTIGRLWVAALDQPPQAQVVPDVVGQPLEAAAERLGTVGIQLGRVEEVPSTQQRPGTVIRQLPLPGQPVQPGMTAGLSVATSPLLRVPEVVGLDVREGARRFADAKVQVETFERIPSEVPEGTILRQRPAAGTEVVPGTAGTLWIAVAPAPPEPDPVPDVVGLLFREAARRLEAVGIAVRRVDRVESDRPQGTVVEQLPAPGSPAVPGSEGALWIADDVLRTVPPVIGRPVGGARSLLDEAGLLAGSVAEVPSERPSGDVIRQIPAAGTRVPAGSSVDLEVSAGPAPPEAIAIPSVIGATVDDAARRLEGRGFALGRLDSLTADEPAGTIVDQSPGAGVLAAPAAAVRVWISSGPATPMVTVAIPDLEGLGRAEAEATLAGLGLQALGEGSAEPAAVVVEHFPAAGVQVPPGTGVLLTLQAAAVTPVAGPLRWLRYWPAGAPPIVLLALFLALRLRGARGRGKKDPQPPDRVPAEAQPETSGTGPGVDYRARRATPSGSVDVVGPLLPDLELGLRARRGPARVEMDTPAGGALIPTGESRT